MSFIAFKEWYNMILIYCFNNNKKRNQSTFYKKQYTKICYKQIFLIKTMIYKNKIIFHRYLMWYFNCQPHPHIKNPGYLPLKCKLYTRSNSNGPHLSIRASDFNQCWCFFFFFLGTRRINLILHLYSSP